MKTVRINVEAQLEWEATQTSAGTWMAKCDPMGLTLEGATLDELHGLIDEAINALFSQLIADGELEQFLIARGWSHADSSRAGDDLTVSMPWRLIAEGGHDGSTQHAA